jgi:hypothetical protein
MKKKIVKVTVWSETLFRTKRNVVYFFRSDDNGKLCEHSYRNITFSSICRMASVICANSKNDLGITIPFLAGQIGYDYIPHREVERD